MDWAECCSVGSCDCMYGLGGVCICDHDSDMHDDCGRGFIHCHHPVEVH